MERYDSYKDSGVDWIGQIPEQYSITKLKYISNLFGRIGFRGYNSDDLNQEGIGAITISPSNIIENRLDLSKVTYLSWAKYYESPEIQVRNNDILLVKTGSCGKSCYVSNLSEPATINPQLLRIVPKCFPKFLYYCLQSLFFKYAINCYITGSTVPTISQTNIGAIYILVPSTEEQQAIAAYLDEEIGKLDDAVEKLERMVEVLKERKQLIISKAVTRGLGDSVPLKDSGVEWIGQIPEHWSINRFKAIFTLNTGISFTKADLVETGQPVISYGQVHSKLNQVAKANLSLIKYIPQSLTIGKQKSYCLPNDFIFADTSEDFEGCGNNFYNDSELSVFAGSHTILAKLRCNLEGKYLAYLFSTSLWRQQIRSRVNGVKVFSITQSILKATSVILPPIAEQQAIAAYLDEKVGKLDEAIEKQLRMIELLKERKQILISDVVTGKIKVA